jgi:sigma-B regulation protein RsbU (phosphoserine phosphatase)
MIFALWLRSSGGAGLPYGSLPGTGLWIGSLLWIGALALGLVSLVSNYQDATSADALRPIQVIFWGFVAALGPALMVKIVAVLARTSVGDLAVWIWFPAFVALFLLPLTLGYAVSARQVLDVPVILKRGARFLLVQRGAMGLLLLVGGAIGVGLADGVSGLLEGRIRAATILAVIVGLACGTLLVWAGALLHQRIKDRIDRSLFREMYRTQQILRDLGTEIQSATTVEDLALRLERQIEQALVPSSFALYLTCGENLRIARGEVEEDLAEIPLSQPLVPESSGTGRGVDESPYLHPIGSLHHVAELGPDCVVPIECGKSLLGLLVLGPRRSDEPYSDEDKSLLTSAARQAGQVLERLS